MKIPAFAEPILVALGFYSVLPVPAFEWTKESMRASLCFLPLVGAVVGGAVYLWRLISAAVGFTNLFPAVAVVIPLVITGGLHLDGFMDTADALSSHQTRERRLEIMKDPHLGAFAVIKCAVVLLLSLGLYGEAGRVDSSGTVIIIALGFVLSRALCVFSAMTMPNAHKGGLLSAFTEHAQTAKAKTAMAILSALCAAAMLIAGLKTGACALAGAFAAYAWYRRVAMKEFGGATGDTSGFFIQICELCLLAGAVIGERL